MTCSICLESYMDLSKPPSLEDSIPYRNLATGRVSPTPGPCCFPIVRPQPQLNVDKKQDNPSSPVATKCGHVFHFHCITNWFESLNGRKDGCPMCRRPLKLKNLVHLHLEPMSIIRQDTTAGVLVSMSLNQYNTLKGGYSVGYSSGMEKFKEEHEDMIKKIRMEGIEETENLKKNMQILENHNQLQSEKLKTAEEVIQGLQFKLKKVRKDVHGVKKNNQIKQYISKVPTYN